MGGELSLVSVWLRPPIRSFLRGQLKAEAARVPARLGECVRLDEEEARQLHALLYKILKGFDEE